LREKIEVIERGVRAQLGRNTFDLLGNGLAGNLTNAKSLLTDIDILIYLDQ
jgi:hypothetical protein